MNLLKMRSSAPAKSEVSGSSSPGVGQARTTPSRFIVLQSVVIFHSTKSTTLPSGSSSVTESPSPLINQFGTVKTYLSPGMITMLVSFHCQPGLRCIKSPSVEIILHADKSID